MFGRPQFAGKITHDEKCKFRCRLGKNIRRVGEGNFVAGGISAIDIVETDRTLCDCF
jgi:hypothetical protein